MSANSKYKNSVFTKLFSDKTKLRRLYNALTGSSYGSGTPLVINTLQDVLYMNRLNDISFVLDNILVILIEHQSTINLNMPLRFLLYIARLYEKILDTEGLYRETRIKIEKPEFIVLYNGLKPMPDHMTLKLSDAFKAESREAPILELVVKVYNVNKGHNDGILKKSGDLREYTQFIDMMRENGKTLPREEAAKLTIRSCIKQGILIKFLKEHASEVQNMLLAEWDWDAAKQVWQEEAKEKGLDMGIEKTLSLIRQGYTPEQVETMLRKKETTRRARALKRHPVKH
jgi:hypothetical protein